jgi:mono/diheme cytochrome c family protein
MSAKSLLCLVAGVGLVAAAQAADPRMEGWSFGASQYQARCAACHGASGKGGGPAAKGLKLSMPDLTTYAARNGGKFPTDLAWQKIDGRPVGWDFERAMPQWGSTFRHEAQTLPYPAGRPETYVAAEIYAIIEHLKSIQAK